MQFSYLAIVLIIVFGAFPAKKAMALELKPIDLSGASQVCSNGSTTFLTFWDKDSDNRHFIEARKIQDKYLKKEIESEPIFIGDLVKSDTVLSRFRTDNIGSEVIAIPQDSRYSTLAVAYPDNRDIPSVLRNFIEIDRRQKWKYIDIFCGDILRGREVLTHVRILLTAE